MIRPGLALILGCLLTAPAVAQEQKTETQAVTLIKVLDARITYVRLQNQTGQAGSLGQRLTSFMIMAILAIAGFCFAVLSLIP